MSDRSLFIIIVGCGRLGSYLANRLSRDGHSLVVIDINESAFDTLSSEYTGFRVEGDAIEFAVLKQAKMDEADAVIVTTLEDNVNLMVAQIAKKVFHVPKVMARVFDPKREEIYGDLGVETICPTLVLGNLFLELITKSSPVTEKGS